ncbi:MAG: hypothetical protein LAO21_20230 [Acidobacteriia bacterium]|nr:hypothetical protein [Terriglobia bacterium]
MIFSQQASSKSAFTLKPGQAVYLVAAKSNGNPDLSSERKIKEEFEKQKVFKIASSLQSADFVFIMLVEYEYNQSMVGGIGIGSEDIKSILALGVPPSAYSRYKANLDGLREESFWQLSENNNAWRTGGLPKKIVKKFHEMVPPK